MKPSEREELKKTLADLIDCVDDLTEIIEPYAAKAEKVMKKPKNNMGISDKVKFATFLLSLDD